MHSSAYLKLLKKQNSLQNQEELQKLKVYNQAVGKD